MWAGLCGVMPDVDILWTPLGLARDSIWAHRGITHSFFFAAVLGGVVAYFGFPGTYWRGFRARLWLAFALATATHGLLDSLTTYFGGIALFAPFSAQRFFFTWRPLSHEAAWAHSLPVRLGYIAGTEILCIWVPALILIAGTLRAQRAPPRESPSR